MHNGEASQFTPETWLPLADRDDYLFDHQTMKHEVSLRQLSEMLGINQSQARKYVLGLGFNPPQARTPDSRGKLTYAFTEEEAEQIVSARRQAGFIMGDTRGTPSVRDDIGVFYIIQIVPELAPNRLKFGFAARLHDRLAQHRTSAPTACILRSWPSRRTWEPALIDCLASVGCELILNEVYECYNLESLLDYTESLFKLMPDPSHRVPLSNASPLRDGMVEQSHALEPAAGSVSNGKTSPPASDA